MSTSTTSGHDAASSVSNEVPDVNSSVNHEAALDQLGGLSIAEAWNEGTQKKASLLMQGLDIHPGKSDQRDGLILNEDSRAKAKAAAELWKDKDQRKKFLKDANFANDEDLDDMWEATEAWLNHAKNPVPIWLIESVDKAVKKCQSHLHFILRTMPVLSDERNDQ